ncbi:alpha/beta fold hydrolase [bacterium]|nr:alpha/beta fold hydrolase [bacterium]
MRTGWLLALIGLALSLGGGLVARQVQTSGGVDVRDIRIETADGRHLSALLYTPPNATLETPAPAILAVHGYINSRETQSAFAIEFARRGYVVLALDQSGHGFSDPPAFAEGFGGPAALAYLRTLPNVDASRIGLEGHSMGGWTSLAAAASDPDGYRAIALVGSSTGPPFSAPATPDQPRNLAVIFSRFDEFSRLMWGVEKAADIATSEKLLAAFGAEGAVQPGRIYGSIESGTGRRLTVPNTTHPGDHISTEAVADAITWMDATLGAPNPIPESSQVWWVKEIATLAALVGGLVFLLGCFDLISGAGVFAAIRAPGVGGAERVSPVWMVALLASSLIPAIAYFPLTGWGDVFAPGLVFRQGVTNQILVWTLAPAISSLVGLGFSWRKGGEGALALKLAAGLVAVAALYGLVILSDVLFKTDMRFWVVALKPFAPHHWTIFLAYLLPFTASFYITQRVLHATLTLQRSGAFGQYAVAVVATAGGFTAMILGVYGYLFAVGRLPGTDPLYSVIAMQFVPILIATAIISVFTFRRTNGAFTGAIICGTLITWYVVAGQATQV